MYHVSVSVLCFAVNRKLLEEHQLEPGTKAAQQEELERRKRLEQQRKDYPLPAGIYTHTQCTTTLVRSCP